MSENKKILYLDCGMGAAGDMLTAALLELFPDPEEVLRELNALGLPGIEYRKETTVRCGITGTHMTVLANGTEESEEMFGSTEEKGQQEQSFDLKAAFARIPAVVRKDVKAVYRLIAEAESRVHGMPLDRVHFHEVGSMDAVADVTAVCLLMRRLDVGEVIVSPVNTGTGKVKCAHGILPVPAPATAWILRGIPTYDNGIASELCTPTGAALLKHFATRFGSRPVMEISAVGYGMGKKEFETANCVRAILGEAVSGGNEEEPGPGARRDKIVELACNLDDMTAEEIGFAMDRLFEAGAADVFLVPAMMKKNRPATVLHVLCREELRDTVVRTVFKYTTTIGIREMLMQRYVLDRAEEVRETSWGRMRVKTVSGYGVSREKYEYDDLAAAAREKGVSIAKIRGELSEKK